MKKYIMAIDQGTTSSRCILFDSCGKVKSLARKEFQQIYPKPGYVEHNPVEIWSSTASVIAEAMSQVGIEAEDVAGIGITNQRETTIVWDKTSGEPVCNAIVWQCRRTAGQIDALKGTPVEAYIHQITGLIPDAYFSASKIAWILDNIPGAREKAERGQLLFGTVDTWLIWNLTRGKVHVSDFTNASRTMLFDIRKMDWDDKLLEYFNIPRSMMPGLCSSSEIYGLAEIPVLMGVPVAGIAGDQQAALFGQNCFELGCVKNTYGTGCFLLMNTGETPVVSKQGLLTTLTASSKKDRPEYALEGSVFAAGAAIQWLRDELKLIESAADSEEIAEKASDTAGAYMVPAFTGLGAPYWDAYARGCIVGITRGFSRVQFVRAVLESIAYQTVDIIRAMEADAGITLKDVRVDGGACENNFLLQFQADILGCDVLRPECIETTALGAAYLAGLAVGFWKDKEDLKNYWSLDRVFKAKMGENKSKELLKGWKKAVKCSFGWAKEE